MTRDAAPHPELARAEAWLAGLIDVERQSAPHYERLGLGPVRALLDRVGRPHEGLRVVHVAGSKGKGSTALLAEALLRARGERVGTFTSPHLSSWTERFRVDGREAAPERLVAAVDALRPHVEALRAGPPEGVPSWFDVTTAAAFLIFREAGVDTAVVEVGLGGRLDSTNVVDPAVACITTIEREHTRMLGDTLAAIAGEKAGILKPGRPAVMGDLAPEAAAVVEARAKALGAPLARLGEDFRVAVRSADADGLALELEEGDLRVAVRMPLLGAHHAPNAALALACVRRLPHRAGAAQAADLAGAAHAADLAGADRVADLGDAARRAFGGACLPARTELLRRDPPVVVDAAHTVASAEALSRALDLLPARRRRLVLSVSADKELPEVLAPLLAHAVEVTVTRAEPTRSLDPRDVAAVVRRLAPGVALRAIPNPFLALRSARERQAPDEVLCAAGSIYLAGIARRVLAP